LGFGVCIQLELNYNLYTTSSAHDPLSLIVRYCGHSFVMCISLFITLYMLLNASKGQFVNKKFSYAFTNMCLSFKYSLNVFACQVF